MKGVDIMVMPAKSAKLQLLQGNPNKRNTEELKKRAEMEEKLRMESNEIIAPNWLDKVGKETFEFIKKELLSIELITNPDTFVIAMYCNWYAEYVHLNKQYKKMKRDHKREYKKQVESGEEVTLAPELYGNPLSKQMDTCSRNLRSFGSDLGLSPSARAKLAIKLAEEESLEDEDDY